jgi:hypothetical protein
MEINMDITLDAEQSQLLEDMVTFVTDSKESIMVIDAISGAGKSTLIGMLIERIIQIKKVHTRVSDDYMHITKFYLTATTNPAVASLHGVTKDLPDDIMVQTTFSTIHSLLGLRLYENFKTGKTNLAPRKEGLKVIYDNTLGQSVVIIDEASYIDKQLQKYINEGIQCKVIYIGDKDQLTSEGEEHASIYINSPVPVRTLSTCYRALDPDFRNFIVYLKQCVHEGVLPEIPESIGNSLFCVNEPTFEETITDAYTTDPDNCKVLAFRNFVVNNYVRGIRNILGKPEDFQEGELVYSVNTLQYTFNIIAFTNEIKRIKSVTPIPKGIETNIFRNMGVHDASMDCVYISLDTDAQRYSGILMFKREEEYRRTLKAAARAKDWHRYFNLKKQVFVPRDSSTTTVHKSQGSTVDYVFVDLQDIYEALKYQSTRTVARLIYVAISRARKQVFILK